MTTDYSTRLFLFHLSGLTWCTGHANSLRPTTIAAYPSTDSPIPCDISHHACGWRPAHHRAVCRWIRADSGLRLRLSLKDPSFPSCDTKTRWFECVKHLYLCHSRYSKPLHHHTSLLRTSLPRRKANFWKYLTRPSIFFARKCPDTADFLDCAFR